MSRIYNPRNGLITEEEYILRRTEALLGRAYIIRVNGCRYKVLSKLSIKERLALIKVAKLSSDKFPQKNRYIYIDCSTRSITFESVPDMSGTINGIDYIDYFVDTPFEKLKIFEKLW